MMTILRQHKLVIFISIVVVIVIGFVVFEVLSVMQGGKNVPTPDIPRESLVTGEGAKLRYLIMGDSTAVAQGADYAQGYAIATAQHLAGSHQVTMVNVGVSGARAKDVATQQISKAQEYKPDLVLIAVGSNDVTHLTRADSLENSIRSTINQLVKANCDVKIVVTGAAQMGSVPRFPQPLRAAAGLRTTQLNKVFDQIAASQNITFARIAEQTGRQFRQDPSLFAQDNFHPNARGYAVWTPVLNQALDDALVAQPTHCPTD
jgi:lysophospholipase L1-like esterase